MNMPEEITEVIARSWRGSTQTQYGTYLRKWLKFCEEHSHDPYVTSVNVVLTFLHNMNTKGLSYSSLNATRSAISAFVVLEASPYSVGNHPWITRYLKGIFNIKPPVPRYQQIWDSRIVLDKLRTWGPVAKLTFKQLTLKVCIMLALLGAARTQLLKAFRVDKLDISDSCIRLRVDELMKTDRPGKVGHELVLKAYPVDRRLCIVRAMKEYLEVTKTRRTNDHQLLISIKEPHGPVSKDTIAKWIREMLALAGLDVNIYKAHSVRAASVSAAKLNFVPIQDIIKRADWTTEQTFNKYYNKPVKTTTSYESAILAQ